jgi:AbrB family looped-hinge helix DNA binding protein
MKVSVSPKYQVVIPKNVRDKLHIRPGQMVDVELTASGKISITPPPSAEELVDKYAGTLKNTAWQKKGVDAAEWVRKTAMKTGVIRDCL